MARTAKSTKTEPVVDTAVADDSAMAAVISAENNASEPVSKSASASRRKASTRAIDDESIADSDEVEIVSLIPNVVYEDKRTSEYYQWDAVGQIETMTFDAVKAMHRKYKTYFNDMWLKPLDERVIKKLGLTRTYEKYDFLMDESNYTAKNIDAVLDGLSSASSGLKIAAVNRIKDMIEEGVVTDVKVIRKIEKRLDIDLISFLE